MNTVHRILLSGIISTVCLPLRCWAAALLLLGGAAPASASTRIWDGSSSGNWMDLNNWVQILTPLPVFPGDSLIFGPLGARLRTTNDFPAGTAFGLLTFTSPDYDLYGSALTLNAGISVSHGDGSSSVRVPVTLNSDQTFSVTDPAGNLWLANGIGLNGRALAFDVVGFATADGISGNGSVIKRGAGTAWINGPSYSGLATVENGTLMLFAGLGSQSVSVRSNATLGGSTLVNSISVLAGGTLAPGYGGAYPSVGLLRLRSNLNMSPGATYAVKILNSFAVQMDQLVVTGNVQLAGCNLTVNAFSPPPFLTELTIIDNDGADAVSGTFAGLPEGGLLTAGSTPLQITYRGGTGNDVVLTPLLSNYAIWDGGGTNGLWSTATNWFGNVTPVLPANLLFPPNQPRLVVTNDFPAVPTLQNFVMTGSNYVFRGNALHSPPGYYWFVDYAPAGTNRLEMDLVADAPGSVSIAASTLVASGAVTGSNGIALTGSGVLEFTGATPNTYSGTTSVTVADLRLRKAPGVQALGGPLIVAGTFNTNVADGFVDVLANEQLPDDQPVTLQRNSALRLAGVSETIGPLTLSGGNVTNSSPGNTLILNGPVTATTNASINVGGVLSLGNVSQTFSVATQSVLNLNDAIGGAAGFTNAGPGEIRLRGSDANTYAGETVVTGGTLLLAKDPGVTAVPGALRIGDGAGSDLVRVLADNQISDSDTVTLESSGRLELADAVSEVIGGLIFFGGEVATGTGLLALNGNVTASASATAASITGNLSLSGVPIVFNVADGSPTNDLVIGAVISNGGIVKTGPGTLLLEANNPYAGTTTINFGRLLVNGAQPASAVALNGGTLGGTGVVGQVTANGGVVSPGTSVGRLMVNGNLTFSPNATLAVELNGLVPGIGHDQLSVTGIVNLAGAQLTGSVGFASAPGNAFTLISNDGVDAVVGTFAGLLPGQRFTLGGAWFVVSYAGGDGNDVVITRVNAPPQITSFVGLTDGQKQLTLLGAPNATYIIEATTNLLSPPAVIPWLPVSTNTADALGLLQFIDPDATNFATRFYRVNAP